MNDRRLHSRRLWVRSLRGERTIIEARYTAEERKTLDDLATKFGISRERVRQIEQRALGRIKATMRALFPDLGTASLSAQ